MPVIQNCWEFLHCGREPGGHRIDELGICPAAVPNRFDGENRGQFAGRCCWKVAGTHCGDIITGYYAASMLTCKKCFFYLKVKAEENCSFEE